MMRRMDRMPPALQWSVHYFAVVLFAFGAHALEPTLESIAKATGINSGLAVHIGTSDGQLEIGLASGGHMLAQGLALDEASLANAQRTIDEKGLYGLATAVLVGPEQRALPYGDNMVNLLVADIDALKDLAPTDAEIERVLAPKGASYLKKAGQWTLWVKPRPKEMDDWGHFDHGADGNGVSHDRMVRQPLQMQWISGVKPIQLGGNPAGYDPGAGVRVADGRLCADYSLQESRDKRSRKTMLGCFDAFSGVPLWKLPRDDSNARKRWQLVIDAKRIYTFPQKDSVLAALDVLDGKTAITYSAAAGKPMADEGTQVRVAGETIVVNLDNGLYALEAASGTLRWKLPAEGNSLLFPCIDETGKRVFAMESDTKPILRSRWPWAIAKAIVCLDLQTGKEIWRNTEVAGKPIGQLIAAGGYLSLFCGSAIGGRGDKEGGGWVASIRLEDHRVLGEGAFRVAWNDSMYNAIVRDGTIYYGGHTTIYQAPLDTVSVSKGASLSYNQRCNRFAATDNLFISGYVTYLDKSFNGTLQSVARAGCALGATPANGMVYFTPSACGCFTQLRGYTCLSPEALRTACPDDRRLQKLSGNNSSRAPSPAPVPDGPITDEWLRWGERATAVETEPVDAGNGAKIVAVTHRHRVEARDAAGKVLWSFIAGGRVSGKPLVVEGLVIFGCHDGWVYALSAKDGAPAWRYLVAPCERYMVAYGQLESSWPICGVALYKGNVIASAGRHPEIGGGVFVAALNPGSGALVWQRVLSKPAAKITTAGGKTSGNIVPHSFLNGEPTIDSEQIKIGQFAFTPDESNEALQRRLDTNPERKKK